MKTFLELFVMSVADDLLNPSLMSGGHCLCYWVYFLMYGCPV